MSEFINRKKGNWDCKKVAFYMVCSECGAVVRNNIDEVFLLPPYEFREIRYCPHCGSDNRGD